MAKRMKRMAGVLPHAQEIRQLAAAPLADVSGVVHGNAGGSKSRGEKAWTLLFELRPWRLNGGELRQSTLIVRKRPVTEKELNPHMGLIRPNSSVRLRARVVERSVLGRPAALVRKYLGAERADAELRRHAKELRKPVTQKDPQFGPLTLDRRLGLYRAKPKWNGRPVTLHLEAETPEALEAALKTARALWKGQAAWAKRVGRFAVKELLETKNDGWLMEGEKPLTAQQFLKRMKLKSVSADPGGSFSFWHDDGGLFWGHSIQVNGNLKEGLTAADTPG